MRDNIVLNSDSQSFDISGDRNRLEDNVGRNVEADNNFEVNGNGNVLLRNRAIHAAGDICFEIDGLIVRIKKNRAQFCDGGYEIDGENMKVTGNRVTDNGSGDDGFNISCSDETGGADPAQPASARWSQTTSPPTPATTMRGSGSPTTTRAA